MRLAQILLWLLGGLFIAAVLSVAVLRLAYPYELEWMEGGSLQTMQRLLDGQPIYVAPTLEYVPFIYPPLYFQLSAGLSYLLGPGFLPLRLISLLASLGSLLMIFLLVRRRTGDLFWSFTGAALFAATFELSGAWLDLARVDPLYLFWLLLAVVILDRRSDALGHSLAGLSFVLAFFTKQSALLVVLPILLLAMITSRGRQRWVLSLITLGGMGAGSALLSFTTYGWFPFYIFRLPASHEISWMRAIEFWRFDLLAPLPFALLALFGLLLPVATDDQRRDRRWLLTVATGFIGSAYFARLHAGGWDNVLLPAYAILTVILATVMERFFRSGNTTVRWAVLAACFLQFTLLIFNPRDHVPTQADRLAGDQLVARLRQVDGPIWAPYHGWLPAAAGQPYTAHAMAIQDVLRGGDAAMAAELDQAMVDAILQGRWKMILLDSPVNEAEIAARYDAVAPAFVDTSVFYCVTGLRTRPEMVFLRREEK